MIEKGELNGFYIVCDKCDYEEFFDFDNLDEAENEAKKQGWIFPEYADDLCPLCADKEEK